MRWALARLQSGCGTQAISLGGPSGLGFRSRASLCDCVGVRCVFYPRGGVEQTRALTRLQSEGVRLKARSWEDRPGCRLGLVSALWSRWRLLHLRSTLRVADMRWALRDCKASYRGSWIFFEFSVAKWGPTKGGLAKIETSKIKDYRRRCP